MSMLFQLPAVTARVTAFSLPAEMIDTLTLDTSADQKSRCNLPLLETLTGFAAQSRPSYRAGVVKPYFNDLLAAIVTSLKVTGGDWPQSGLGLKPATWAASL